MMSRRLAIRGHLIHTLYFATAPVYWVPGIGLGLFTTLKIALLGLACGLTWFASFLEGKLVLPRGVLGLEGLLLLYVVAAPGLYQIEDPREYKMIQDILLSFLTLWTGYLLAAQPSRCFSILFWSAGLLAAFGGISIAGFLTGFPNWRSPFEFGDLPLSIAAFGGKRTGWSNALGLYTPLALLPLLVPLASRRKVVYPLLAVAGIFGSQVVVAGRAGIIVSLCAVLVIAWKKLPPRYFVIAALLAAALFISRLDSIANFFQSNEHLRLTRLSGGGASLESLDHFSAGRIDGYLYALEQIAERPLTGHGFGNVYFHNLEIHNLWLRLAAESGIFCSLLFGSVAVLVLDRVRRLKRYRKTALRRDPRVFTGEFLGLVIINGLIITMFEPSMLLGSFHNTSMWWLVGGVIIRLEHDVRKELALRSSLARTAQSTDGVPSAPAYGVSPYFTGAHSP